MRAGAIPLVALAVLLLAAACGKPPVLPDVDLGLWIQADRTRVHPGEPFEVRVERVWSKDLPEPPWDERALEPLAHELLERERETDGRRVREVLRYRAWAFALGEVATPRAEVAMSPLRGAPERRATAAGLRIEVVPALDPADPGPPEGPGGPLAEPTGPWPWVGAGLLLLALGAILLLRLRPGEEAAAADAPPSSGEAVARARAALAALADAPAAQAVVGAAEVLRRLLAEALGLPAPRRTSEQVAAVLAGRLPPAPCADVAAVLARADAVKFARGVVTAPEAAATLERAERGAAAIGEAAP